MTTDNTTTQTGTTISSSYKANREKLRELSALAKKLVESGQAESVNDGLIQMYKDEGHSEFKTFNQWKDEGKSIKKGSKAFLVWASPKDIPNPNENSDEEEVQYFPLCYLFSDQQVTERSAS